MHSYRVFITLLTNPIVASSAAFLGVSQPIIGTASTSLNSRSPGSNDSPVNTFDLDTADPIHESGNENRYGEYGYNVSDDDDDDNYDDEGEDGDDDEDEDDDEDDDDAWEEEFDPNSDNIADRETSLNTTFHTSGSNKRTLHVKKIKCSHHWAGQNILGAVDALTDWGHEHLVGRKNWHWESVPNYHRYAIVWMCNCNKYHDKPINCWEINEALRLIAKKCGPEKTGRVTVHGRREFGLGSIEQVRRGHTINPFASLCHRIGCCNHFNTTIIPCGRPHPSNKDHQGDSCNVNE
ncbi:hypothetical protein F5X97DRAFT_297583 [Nemania serpens]|nr:hypothetical protein F5X97DRAFT_297583 [Nemania serpens]